MRWLGFDLVVLFNGRLGNIGYSFGL